MPGSRMVVVARRNHQPPREPPVKYAGIWDAVNTNDERSVRKSNDQENTQVESLVRVEAVGEAARSRHNPITTS